jgi:malonyl-CoA O-methyltransferase
MKQDTDSPFYLDKARVRQHFDRAASTYSTHAVIQNEIAQRFLERFDFIKMKPEKILDIGCGTGALTKLIMKKFSGASITALDLSKPMLQELQSSLGFWQRLRKKVHFVQADAESLPFDQNVFDLIVSNLTLQWCNSLDQVFAQVEKSLQRQGLFMFTTFGPDTMKEVRQAWHAVDTQNHVNLFYDMHDIGDALMRAGFSDPVMDVEHITMTYDSMDVLLRDIKKIGATNATSGAPRGLMSRGRLDQFKREYEKLRTNNVLPVTYEVIYGHAWARQVSIGDNDPGAVNVYFDKTGLKS